jgi:hypothetical protein
MRSFRVAPSETMIVALLLLAAGGVVGQSCFYRSNPGTCVTVSSCAYSYEPSMTPVNTTGCQSNPVRKKKKKKKKVSKQKKKKFFFFFFFFSAFHFFRIQMFNVAHESTAPRQGAADSVANATYAAEHQCKQMKVHQDAIAYRAKSSVVWRPHRRRRRRRVRQRRFRRRFLRFRHRCLGLHLRCPV